MDDKKIALITGANKGIGLETARQLGKRGMTVVIGSRDLANGENAAAKLKADGLDAHAVQLEVTDGASVSAAAERLQGQFGRLDALVNNAGVLHYQMDGPPSKVGQEGLRRTMETNFFGMVLTTQALLPLVRSAPSGRIVNVTSVLGSLAEHADDNSTIRKTLLLAYDASKAAVNMFTVELAYELRDTKIKVNAAHPGWVKTDMGGSGAELEIADGATTSVTLATLPDDGPTGGFYHMGVHMRW